MEIHFKEIDKVFKHSQEYQAMNEPRGVRDQGLLESAVNNPMQTFDGQDLYPDLYSKAAVLWAGLIRNHPFIQANKRTATVAMWVFLSYNHRTIQIDDASLIEFTLRIATDKSLSIPDIASWLRHRARKVD